MNKRLAFTLIELLVVIAVIGILSGLMVVSMSGVNQKAKIAKAKIFSNSLRNSLMLNLVSEWKFDGETDAEQTATINDLLDTWGGNNTSIIIGGTPIVKGADNCVDNKCLSFNGSADYFYAGTGGNNFNVTNVGDSMTVEAWIKTSTSGRSQTIVAKWTPWIFFLDGSRRLMFYIRSGGADTNVFSTSRISYGEWQHVAAVFTKSNRTVNFYINGDSAGSSVFSTDIDVGTGSRFQVAGYGNINTLMNGFIDDVRLYNVAISSSEIKEHYYLGLNNLFMKGAMSGNKYRSLF